MASAALAALVGVFFFVLPVAVDSRLNGVHARPPDAASERARELQHRRLLVADLHADSLLWERSLVERNVLRFPGENLPPS